MIEEAYVTIETARLLEKKGFKEYCPKAYSRCFDGRFENAAFSEWGKMNQFPAPTQQVAMRWLREKYNIHIIIETTTAWFGMAMGGEYRMVFEPRIEEWNFNPPRGHGFPDKRFCSYEEACEAAIKHSLENLI